MPTSGTGMPTALSARPLVLAEQEPSLFGLITLAAVNPCRGKAALGSLGDWGWDRKSVYANTGEGSIACCWPQHLASPESNLLVADEEVQCWPEGGRKTMV